MVLLLIPLKKTVPIARQTRQQVIKKARRQLRESVRQARQGRDGWCSVTNCAYSDLRALLKHQKRDQEIDHIYPLTAAHTTDQIPLLNDIRNLQILHKKQNVNKSDHVSCEAKKIFEQILKERAAVPIYVPNSDSVDN